MSSTLASLGSSALTVVESAVLVYCLMVNVFLAVLLVSSAAEMRRHRLEVWLELPRRLLSSAVAPRISMLVPAYDEATTVTESLRSLLTLRYPELEIVLINDGSDDTTLAVLQRDFDLTAVHPIYRRRVACKSVHGIYRSRTNPGLVVVDKANGGKADALNAGLNVASGQLVCAVDADTIIDPDALLHMVRPFLLGDRVIATGGTIRAANGAQVHHGRVTDAHAPRSYLAGVQTIEYLRAFLTGRLGWNRLGGNLIVSGAFGMFRRDNVLDAGGYEHNTVGEDMELIARLRRRAVEAGRTGIVSFIPDPVAWTEVPETLRDLARQRDRWHRGLADVLWRHRRLLLNPRYGSLGLVAMPYFFFVELLSPVVEAVGIVTLVVGLSLGAVDHRFAALFFLLAYGFGLLLTILTLALDEWNYRAYGGLRERLRLLGFAILEPLGYRQLTVLWRLRGLVNFLRGRTDWGAMSRTGFAAERIGSGEPSAPPKD